MLKSLRIKNYAIINDLSIEFDNGFNVFTGETGAGKSIIVGALSYLLKGRSDSSIVRKGCDRAIIEGVFTIDNQLIKDKLNEQDIDFEDEIIVKRVISSDNKNSIKINESSVTLNYLTNLMSDYIDIHSQKDSQFLFKKQNQIYLLDKYSENESLLDEYTKKYENYCNVLKEYDELINNTYSEREIEFYKYDYNELLEANLSIDEEEELDEQEKRSKASEKYIQSLSKVINLFSKDSGAKELLFEMINGLDIDDEKLKQIKESITNSYYSIDENVDELTKILKSFENSEYSIEKIEERLFLYSKLKRKHKTDTSGLLELQNKFETKIKSFEDRDFVIEEKKKEVNLAKNIAYETAKEIHERRIKNALKLQKLVVDEATDLMLNNCKFEIKVNETELYTKGFDDIEFYVSLNKGEEVKPLKNVASGGEISRLMLALKSVFAKDSDTELLILDEIDTGVSGKVGLSVGRKIAKIAKNIQVLCITHLSPVAACGDAHYYIYKEDDSDSSNTKIRRLNNEEIINELASISNTNTNQKALDAAKELYDLAQNTK